MSLIHKDTVLVFVLPRAYHRLSMCLSVPPVLTQLKARLKRSIAAENILNSAVTDLQSAYDRKQRNMDRMTELWGTEEFIPSSHKPPCLSNDLVQHFYMLSKEVKDQQMELSALGYAGRRTRFTTGPDGNGTPHAGEGLHYCQRCKKIEGTGQGRDPGESVSAVH